MNRFFFLVVCVFSAIAMADQNYIKEVQSLLDSLPPQDPGRLTLSLRLADALFEDTVANPGASAIHRDRQKALRLYEESLPKVSGELSAKVRFQMARLYSDEGQGFQAEKIWKILVNQDTWPVLKRESALRLAEIADQPGKDLKAAETYYKTALGLCAGLDVCSYCHYRLGWVYQKQNQTAKAVDEMQKALWDSKGNVREESLRDLIGFLALLPGDGKESFGIVELLDAKLHRPSLQADLAEAFYAAGNRQAGTFVLERVNKRSPSMKYHVKLLEEFYGFRDWGKFQTQLNEAIAFDDTHQDASWRGDGEIEKTLRRLMVQLDAERLTQSSRTADFKNTVALYLAMFPESPDRHKMIDGWLAAEKEYEPKVNQLKTWIREEHKAGRTKDELRLREMRASFAQKIRLLDVIDEEMAVIAEMATTPDKRREALYQRAHALYDKKDYSQSLPLFKEIAQVESAPDKWAVLSEHLALDIMAQQRAYRDVWTQARSWTENPQFANWERKLPEQAKELEDLKKIATEAEFETAVAQGASAEALKTFEKFCAKDLLLPKSCDNAKILAVKLKKESVLISLLKKEGKLDELTAELEASGRFAEAAVMLEKDLKKKNLLPRDFLKVSLLYELNERNDDRDRLLRNMIGKFSSQNSWGDDEDLVYDTLKEASLLNASSLRLPWKNVNRMRLVGYLEQEGKGNAETRKILTASCENLGPAWVRNAFTELKNLDDQQRQIGFYGRAGKKKFEKRLAGLKKLVAAGDCYLQGADARGRVLMAILLARSQAGLAEEIKASPLPPSLDEEQAAQLKQSLDQMARPFVDKAKDFEALAREQLAKVESPADKAILQEKISYGASEFSPETFMDGFAQTRKGLAAVPDKQERDTALAVLNENPAERGSLEKLRNYYEHRGEKRLAAYFEGRILQLNK